MFMCIIMLIRNEFAYDVRKKILDAIRHEGDMANDIYELKKVEDMLDKYPLIGYHRLIFSLKSSKKMEKECRELIGLDGEKK